MSEEEKEKKAEERRQAEESTLKEAQKRAIQQALDGGKALADISSEERFYNRSVKIRRKIMKFLIDNDNQSYDSLGDLEAQAANYANCSMPTSRRWLYQWTRPGKPFYIQEGTDFYIIRSRDP